MKWTDRHAEQPDDGVLDDNTEMALREGLRAQPAPPVSADFDARVLRAVSGRSPLWDVVLSSLRPAIATAAVSTFITTLVLSSNLSSNNPALAAGPPSRPQAAEPNAAHVSKALASGAYLSMEPWRPMRAPAPARHRRHPGS